MSTRLEIRIQQGLSEQLKAEAKKRGLTDSEFVRLSIQKELGLSNFLAELPEVIKAEVSAQHQITLQAFALFERNILAQVEPQTAKVAQMEAYVMKMLEGMKMFHERLAHMEAAMKEYSEYLNQQNEYLSRLYE